MTTRQLSLDDFQRSTRPPREYELAHVYNPERDGKVRAGETLTIYADGRRELVKTESLDTPPIKVAKLLNDVWSEGGQIYYQDGAAWGVTEDLSTICLGPAELIYNALITGTRIKSHNPAINQTIEMERRILHEQHTGEPRTAKASGRAYKPVRANNKRVRLGGTARRQQSNARRHAAGQRTASDIPKPNQPGV